MHVVTNAAEPDLAVQYIDTHLDPAVQSAMSKPPYDVIATNSKVPLEGAITKIAQSYAELARIRSFDWEKLNPQRSALIERFNREIKL
jgi:putative spermidine/putrescine transport system substrate-binding protein